MQCWIVVSIVHTGRPDKGAATIRNITQTDGIKVGLLIGANCMKVLEPLKAISSFDGGPYAYQTRLGWCVVGHINMFGKKSIGYN